MNKLLSVFLLFLTFTQSARSSEEFRQKNDACSQAPGLLVVAHGSTHDHHGSSSHSHLSESESSWDEMVRGAVEKVQQQLSMPVELAFGMWDQNSFEQGVKRLADRGICELRVVPLFVSSFSEVIDIQKYMFGTNDWLRFPMSIGKVFIPGQIQQVKYGTALDDHSYVSDILYERLQEISTNPQQEAVLLIGHGPFGDIYEPMWLGQLQTHGQRIQNYFFHDNGKKFFDFSYFTLRDDSPYPIRNARTQAIRSKIRELNKKSITPIVLPVLLSEGGIESGIFERLKGLNYKIQTQFLMPHDKIVQWIVERARTIE